MTQLMRLYRRVPALACQGHCAESCGPIVVARAEAEAMARAAGGRGLTVDRDLTCGYLKDGRCTVYEARPLICRLWGVALEMPCPWGCQPARVVSRREGQMLLETLKRIGGDFEPSAFPESLELALSAGAVDRVDGVVES